MTQGFQQNRAIAPGLRDWSTDGKYPPFNPAQSLALPIPFTIIGLSRFRVGADRCSGIILGHSPRDGHSKTLMLHQGVRWRSMMGLPALRSMAIDEPPI
ncbi:MAG: hypothetical protein EA367_15240 [Leptolyngbya sp. DLM2.Bin15]|nr:MAG: hypothetical protein EA367_15240 [Leptolyngbya sp. DLM2.Bin15]